MPLSGSIRNVHFRGDSRNTLDFLVFTGTGNKDIDPFFTLSSGAYPNVQAARARKNPPNDKYKILVVKQRTKCYPLVPFPSSQLYIL